jgi:hypothetical protein
LQLLEGQHTSLKKRYKDLQLAKERPPEPKDKIIEDMRGYLTTLVLLFTPSFTYPTVLWIANSRMRQLEAALDEATKKSEADQKALTQTRLTLRSTAMEVIFSSPIVDHSTDDFDSQSINE